MKLPFEIKINFLSAAIAVWRFFHRRKHKRQFFGLVKDKWDGRDVYYKARYADTPESTNRANFMRFSKLKDHIYDQGQLGSCVANMAAGMFRYVLQRNNQPDFNPSRLFEYYNARADKSQDTGTSIREGMKALNKFGLCAESSWPYDIRKFTLEPPAEAFKEGELHQSIIYERIFPVTKQAIKDAIYNGYPVGYGMILYESFMSDSVAMSGMVPIPKRCREHEIGGHAKWIIDYDERGVLEVNSWGEKWGYLGFCVVPWEYILNEKLCTDFWVLKLTE